MRLSFAGVTCAVLLASGLGQESELSGDIRFVAVEGVSEFPEAAAPRAIQYACSDRTEHLATYFNKAGLRFNQALVHRVGEFRACHIYYEPSVPGFRATPETSAVTAVHTSVDPVSFIIRRAPTGDSLDILKTVMPYLPKALGLTLVVSGDIDPSYWPAAVRFHFPGTARRLDIRSSGTAHTYPWAQDYMKAGQVNGRLRILTPRRLYQSRSENEDLNLPILDRMQEGAFVKSKLSWEGGDLLVVEDPGGTGRRILLHGKTPRLYWGQHLNRHEISDVLLTEFGADIAVDLSWIGPHVDYLVAFLPEGGIALVAEPVRQNPDLIRVAVDELMRIYGRGAPSTLRLLAGRIAAWDGDFSAIRQYLRSAISDLHRELPKLDPAIDSPLDAPLDNYIETHCPSDPDVCFDTAGKNRMLQEDPELLRRASSLAAEIEVKRLLAPRLLFLMEGQLPDAPPKHRDALNHTAEALRSFGFRVVRIPFFVAPDSSGGWPGVSYVNLLSIERTLFVPALGLGEAEDRIFDSMRQKLAGRYSVVPVDARLSLLENGGVHCVLGVVREVAPPRT